MLIEWIEPAKERRIWEVVEHCEEEHKEYYDRFNVVLNKLKKHVPLHMVDDLNMLEDIFLQKNSSLYTAYNFGFEDALKLIKELRQLT
ncbi:hypothetical protein AWU65_20485 [Paenibacillus glucanolyticus]|uniref:Uncharacterized protein n=1 Tax=Paenibacillus glucanolyticus TaxID=59843 RepID=A0A163LHL0_9BACL|nr:hypothetical protein [Paenibacillus glucanolyticus]KZS48136.1 hypothetical protein AWU65_20485 [Paenibacillus glucanolyticus]